MKRIQTIVSSVAVLTAVLVISLFVAHAQRRPRESVELPTPATSPSVITPGVPTFITFTISIPDQRIRFPTLQFFNPTKQRWRAVKRLRDDGRGGDEVRGDRTFTLRARFFESSGTTQIAVPTGRTLRAKGEVPSLPQLRLMARKTGQRGIVVSQTFSLLAPPPTPVSFGGTGAEQANIVVPSTFTVIDASAPSHVVLEKAGVEGYRVEVTVGPNTEGLDLQTWIFRNAFGFTEPGDPSTFSEYPRAAVEPIQVSGLSGVKVTRMSLQRSVEVFLNDPVAGRVFWFAIFADNAGQDLNLRDNLAEALSIVRSLQM